MPSPSTELGRPALIAGALALVGAVLCLVSIFPDFYSGLFALEEVPHLRWFVLVFAVGSIAAGAMLVVPQRQQVVGAAMLFALAVTFVGFHALQIMVVSRDDAPSGGSGFALDQAGFWIVALGGLVAAATLLTQRRALRTSPGTPALTAVAIAGGAAGFLTAFGWGLDYFRPEGVGGSIEQGSPLVPSAESLWAQLLVVLALVALPVVIAFVRREVAAGLAAGLGVFLVAECLFRLLTTREEIRGIDTRYEATTGTWLFVIGALGTGTVLVARLLARGDQPARAPSS